MAVDDLLILTANDIRSVLTNHELDLVEVVRQAYLTFARGEASLPHSAFVRMPKRSRERIIALPAYLGGDFDAAGVKWISSFPQNTERGMERASAVIVLNSLEHGRPEALLEGAHISAVRTAASAALAARYLHRDPDGSVGILGCGLIARETLRFVRAATPALRRAIVFDVRPERARAFENVCSEVGLDISVESSAKAVIRQASLLVIATTALTPHIDSWDGFPAAATVLHISLRDLAAEMMLSCRNIVDDVDHVCREQTSLHKAEQLAGHRRFIHGTLAQVMEGALGPRERDGDIAVFSPFGLGVLDVAVANQAREWAKQKGFGILIPSFFASLSNNEPVADRASQAKY